MNTSLMRHTQQAYILSLNIITRNNGTLEILPIPLVSLTTLIFALWSARQQIARHWEIMRLGVEVGLNGAEWFYVGVERMRGNLL